LLIAACATVVLEGQLTLKVIYLTID